MGSLRAIAIFGLLTTLLVISGQQTPERVVDVSLQNRNPANVTDFRRKQPLVNGTRRSRQDLAGFFNNLSAMFGKTDKRLSNGTSVNGLMGSGSPLSGSNGPSSGVSSGPGSLGGGMDDIFNTMAAMFMGGGPPGVGRGAGGMGRPGASGMGGPGLAGMRGPGAPGRMGIGSGGPMRGPSGMSSMFGMPSTMGRGRPPLGRPGAGNMNMFRGLGGGGGIGNLFGQEMANPMAMGGNFRQQSQQWGGRPQQQQWGSLTGNMPQQWGSNTPGISFPPAGNTARPRQGLVYNDIGGQQSNPMSNWGNGQNRMSLNGIPRNMGGQQGNGMMGPQGGGMGPMAGMDMNMLSGVIQSMLTRFTGRRPITGPPPTPKPVFCQEYECPPFTVLKRGQNYELRRYGPMTFASADIPAEQFSKIKVYWTLAEYMLQGKNSESLKMPLTVPILTKNDTTGNLTRTMYFLLPYLRQRSPPSPVHPWVKIVTVPAMEVYVRPAKGYLSESQFGVAAEKFRADLGPTNPVLADISYTAFYDTMFKFRARYNEIWLVSKFLGNEETIATYKSSQMSMRPPQGVQNNIFQTNPNSQSPSAGPPKADVLNNPTPNFNTVSTQGVRQVEQRRDPLQEFMNRHSENLQSQRAIEKPSRNPIFFGSQDLPFDNSQQNPAPPTLQPSNQNYPFNRQTESAISPPGNATPNAPISRQRQGPSETAVDAGSKQNVQVVTNINENSSAGSPKMPTFNSDPRQRNSKPPASFVVRPGFNFF